MVKIKSIIEAQVKEFIELIRPPVDMRDKIDIGYSFQNNTLELFEIQPKWDNPSEKVQSSFAKSKFVKTQGVWKNYWKRASGKWELYEPYPEVSGIHEFFEIISKDEHGCFFG